ncbi:MAG TPA: FAD-binding protein [Candidatus Eisenbergiella merdavium]|uniref:FAD-binding protein n=1 Tax=Candidatus Eisenbergiella merdavium TaxID=2838551 RepID=A0A9D2NF58_9FIRM|nr:FAD-binding protein [Candidatus Eisenbergiella merdavium]
MNRVLIIGSGISGLTCAIETAKRGGTAVLVSPYPSERSQSVMAAGGINAVLAGCEEGDSVELHISETIKSGCDIAGTGTVTALCEDAPALIEWLESIGVVFTREAGGGVARRAFGGQSRKRTVYAGASTGKQIVTALVQEARRWECEGRIVRRLGLTFHSALINDGVCFGALFYCEKTKSLVPLYADATVFAVGGQNCLFGKTTGSALCDGYAAGRLFLQGAKLKNLEFIQYHPTTIETPQKRMLITEGARGDGGRLYYVDGGGKRVYFMEDMYGERGNLMPRDIVSKCIYDAPLQVYLDISFLGEKKIKENLKEVYDLCGEYLGLDVTKESIPVAPSVHFFMGGLAVDIRHRTNIKNMYAVGECASIYHGANRLGGNSLLAAVHGGKAAARSICEDGSPVPSPGFDSYIREQSDGLNRRLESQSPFSAVYIRNSLSQIMNEDLGILRTGEKLKEGLESVDYYLSVCDKIIYDSEVSPYQGYSLSAMLTLGRAILACAERRRETRGAHIRADYPLRSDAYEKCSVISYSGGKYDITYESEDEICL